MASLPVIAGQELDEGLEEMWLGSAQGIQAIDPGKCDEQVLVNQSLCMSCIEMHVCGRLTRRKQKFSSKESVGKSLSSTISF